MFKNCCRCCLTENSILLPLKETDSSHGDDKTLWQYLQSIVPSFVEELETSQYICLRCSKALQVSYHFLNMIKKTEESILSRRQNNFENTKSEAKTCVEQIQPEIATSDEEILEKQFQFQIIPIENQPETVITDICSNNKNSKLNKTLFCDICNKLFDNSENLLEHNRTIHKGKLLNYDFTLEYLPYKCKMCNFYSCYTESLYKHYKKKHNLTEVELKLQQTKELYDVVKENPKFEILYKCLKCNFESQKQAAVEDHQLENVCVDEESDSSIIKLFKCPSCQRSFKALKSAKIHWTMYHNSAPKGQTKFMEHTKEPCDKCGALFTLKSGLLLHKRMCAYKEAVSCNFCDLKFSTLLKYEQHLQSNHKVAIQHECEMCGKVFSCSEYLAVHRKRHNERYYQCNLCSKNYVNNAELRIHKQRTHGKLIAQRIYVKSNKNTKRSSSSYNCPYCDFFTYSRFSLRVHQNIHTGKPYKCRLCPKNFVHRQDLRKHCRRLHSINVTNEQLADMFKETYGYCSRFDAFSKQNNNLEITEIDNLELNKELEEFGLTFQDIMRDLFVGEPSNNSS